MMGSTAVLPGESPWSAFDCASASDAAPRASREAIDSWRRRSRMTWNRPVSLIEVPAVMGNRLYPIYTSLTDRKSVVLGKSVSVSLNIGGRRIIKKKKKTKQK